MAFRRSNAVSGLVVLLCLNGISGQKNFINTVEDQVAMPDAPLPVYEIPAHQFGSIMENGGAGAPAVIPTVVQAASQSVPPQEVPWPLTGGQSQGYSGYDQQQNSVSGGWSFDETSYADDHESPLLSELRERIRPLNLNPTVVNDNELKWRIADAGYKVDLAYLRLAKTAAWRRGSGADSMLQWKAPPMLVNKFPYEFTGFSREGYPVFYVPLNQWDFVSVLKSGHGGDMMNYVVRMLEDIRNSTLPDVYHGASSTSSSSGGYSSSAPSGSYGVPAAPTPCVKALKQQAIIILDVGAFSFKNAVNLKSNLQLIKIVKTIGRHYPYLAKKIFVVRAPLAVQGLWKVLRKVATPPLHRAVEIYNRFNKRGQHALLHNIPRNAIPINIGGHFVPVTFEVFNQLVQHHHEDHHQVHHEQLPQASPLHHAEGGGHHGKLELNFEVKLNR